jgi:hypothetical protein
MKRHGVLRIDPPAPEIFGCSDALEIAIPYTDTGLAAAALQRAAVWGRQLKVTVRLIAVHTVPYPMPFSCPSTAHARLVDELIQLAAQSPLDIHAEVILARGRQEAFRSALPPESTVLLAAHRRLWGTPERRLAETLAACGHKVALIYVEN